MSQDHLAIYCTTTRITSLDDDRAIGISVLLSAAWCGELDGQEQAANALDWLRLWNWATPNGSASLQAWCRKRDEGTWREAGEVNGIGWPDPPPSYARLRQRVDRELARIYEKSGAGGLTVDRVTVDEDEAPLEWDSDLHVRHFLAELSTEAAPVPRLLRLAWLARVPLHDPEGVDELIVVPVLAGRRPQDPTEASGLFVCRFEEPAPGDGTADPEDPLIPAPAMFAYQHPVAVHPPSLENIGRDGWVALPSRYRVPASGDVVRSIGARWPDFTDHLRQLLGIAVHLQAPPTGIGTSDWVDLLRRALLNLLRDRTGLGARSGSGSSRDLVSLVAARIPASDEPEDGPSPETRLRAALGSWEATLTFERWASILERWIAERRPAHPSTDGSGTPTGSAGDVAGSMREMLGMVALTEDPGALAALVEHQWDQALASDPSWRGSRNAVLSALRRVLRERNESDPLGPMVRRREESEDGLPVEFADLVEAADPRSAGFLDNLESLVAHTDTTRSVPRLKARLARPLDGTGDLSALDEACGRVAEYVAGRVRAIVDDLQGQGNGAVVPVPTPHGVAIRFLADDRDRPGDVNESLQGYGVLMRRSAPDRSGAWRILNACSLLVPDEWSLPGRRAPGEALEEVAVAPIRLGYERGLRQTQVLYDNQPLAAKSPAIGFTDELLDWAGQLQDARPPLIDPEPVKLPDDDAPEREWALLPGLVFGRTYEIAPFAIFNGGVLPERIRDATDPTRLKAFDARADLLAGLPAPLETVTYLRRVPVGEPRLRGLGDRTLDDLLPRIPDGVAPRAMELTETDREALRLPPVPDATDDEEPGPGDPPLVMLVSEGWRHLPSTVTLPLALPAIDLHTWDRWKAEDPNAKDERVAVWARLHRARDTRASTAVDLADPAVAPIFFVDWWTLSSGGERSEDSDGLTVEAAELDVTISAVASGEGAVRHTVRDIDGIDARKQLQLDVARGVICHLTIRVGVRESEWERFELAEPAGTRSVGDEVFVLGPARELIVEIADRPRWLARGREATVWTVDPARQRELFDALAVHELIDPAGTPHLKLLLDGAGDQAAKLVEDASRYTVRRQAWRWDGRIHERFPFDAVGPLHESRSYRAWLATAFAERRDDDCVRSEGSITHLAAPGAGPGARHELFDLARPDDPRALLHRFGVTLHSRYAPLAPPGETWDLDAASEELDDGVRTTWLSHVDRSRRTRPLPTPRLKLLVPLTEAGDDDLGTAPLLAVLREPWFEVGGLAEELHAEIERVPVYAPSGTAEPLFWLPQFGPDPIASGAAWADGSAVDPEPRVAPERPPESREVSVRPRGPVGFTFDTGSSAPLFSSTAFYLGRPEVPTWAADRDLSGFMYKVRLRRRLAEEGRAWLHADDEGSPRWKSLEERFPPVTLSLAAGASQILYETVPADFEPVRLRLTGMLRTEVDDDSPGSLALGFGCGSNREPTLLVDRHGRLSWWHRRVGENEANNGDEEAPPIDLGDIGDELALDLRTLGEQQVQVTVLTRASMAVRDDAAVRARRPNHEWRECSTEVLTCAAGLSLSVGAIGAAAEIEVQGPIPILESAATEAAWTQLLPSSQAWQIEWGNEAGSSVRSYSLEGFDLESDGQLVHVRRDGVRLESIRPISEMPADSESPPGFLTTGAYLLVTQLISDARGREDESFVDLRPIGDGKCDLRNPAGELIEGLALRGRLVEIQRVSGSRTAASILDDLFPPETSDGSPEDVRARILRVSRPIEQGSPVPTPTTGADADDD